MGETLFQKSVFNVKPEALTTETQGHSFEHYRTLSLTISVTPRERLYTQREAARTRKSQRSRRSVNEEKVHQMELLKDPLIVVRGGDLVARELVAREHQPAARGRVASADRNRTAGAAAASSSISACSGWTPWMLTAIPAQASRSRS